MDSKNECTLHNVYCTYQQAFSLFLFLIGKQKKKYSRKLALNINLECTTSFIIKYKTKYLVSCIVLVSIFSDGKYSML